MIEHFECIRRSVTLSVVDCGLDRRAARGPCDGCAVGDTHARLELARTWPSGEPLRWVGERPDFEAEDAVGAAEQRPPLPRTAERVGTWCPARAAVVDDCGDECAGDRCARLPVTPPPAPPRPRPALRVLPDPPRSEERSDRHAPSPPTRTGDRSAPRGSEDELGEPPKEATVADGSKKHRWAERELTVGEWAREPEAMERGLDRNTLYQRIVVRGWDVERALTTPRSEQHATRPIPPPKPAKPAKNGAPKANGRAAARPKSSTAPDPAIAAALAGIEKRYDEIEAERDRLDAELDKLALAGNALCDVAGIERRWEDA